jgi:prepilin-type N-terminal cleavage/methylation domain-containing protein/prepilin-type processing-associated H-X9-DG protein
MFGAQRISNRHDRSSGPVAPEKRSCLLRNAHRGAFTIIELLVAMTIIGLLAAMLLPALQRVHAAMERLQCAHNMKQIGLAAHDYASVHGRLPVGGTEPYALPASPPSIADASGIPPPELLYDLTLTDSPTRRDTDPIRYPWGPNWAVHLLPYIEQEALFKQAQVGDYMIGYQTGNDQLRDRWREVVKDQVIPIYLCPSGPGNAEPFAGYTHNPGPWARGNYAANAGPAWWQMSLNGYSYTEVYGLTGPVFGINYGAVLHQIPDGSSSTILFNEVRIGVSALDPRGVWAMGYPGASITAANAIGDCLTPNDATETSDDVQGCPDVYYPGIGTRDHMGCNVGFADLGWPSWQAQARSLHPSGVNVCFADGAVRFISNTVEQAVWFHLLSANDGNPVSYLGD